MKPRDKFRNGVFARDNHTCVFCGNPAVDAHHWMHGQQIIRNTLL